MYCPLTEHPINRVDLNVEENYITACNLQESNSKIINVHSCVYQSRKSNIPQTAEYQSFHITTIHTTNHTNIHTTPTYTTLFNIHTTDHTNIHTNTIYTIFSRDGDLTTTNISPFVCPLTNCKIIFKSIVVGS